MCTHVPLAHSFNHTVLFLFIDPDPVPGIDRLREQIFIHDLLLAPLSTLPGREVSNSLKIFLLIIYVSYPPAQFNPIQSNSAQIHLPLTRRKTLHLQPSLFSSFPLPPTLNRSARKDILHRGTVSLSTSHSSIHLFLLPSSYLARDWKLTLVGFDLIRLARLRNE